MVELLCHPSKKLIVSVGLSGTPWGRVERQSFLVLEAIEPELEAELLKLSDDDTPWPQIDYPYQKRIEGVTEKTFNPDILPVKSGVPTKSEIDNPLVDKQIIRQADAAGSLVDAVKAVGDIEEVP